MLDRHTDRTSNADLLIRLLREHGESLRALARSILRNAADTDDALQQASVIFLEKYPGDHPRPSAWLGLVVKREALAIRRRSARAVPASHVEGALDLGFSLTERESDGRPGPDDCAHQRSRARRIGAAMAQLKPAERQALGFIAEGWTYRQIMAETGWTFTKVNRLVAEGRRALREQLGAHSPP